MLIKRLFIFVLLFSCSPDAYGEDNFSWQMFLPAMTNQCRPDNLQYCNNLKSCETNGGYWYLDSCHSDPTCSSSHLDLCVTEQTCIDAGGYWYSQSCHADPEELVCNIDHLDLCFTEQECIDAEGYWYELSCHPSPSPSFVNTQQLAGEWYFRMFPAAGSDFTRTYTLDINTIEENPTGSGKFTITGIDQDGSPVTGAYKTENNDFTMYVTKTVTDILYEFTFTSSADVNGCYFEIDKEDETAGSCISMLGEKL